MPVPFLSGNGYNYCLIRMLKIWLVYNIIKQVWGQQTVEGCKDTSVKGDYRMSNAGYAAILGFLAIYLGVVIVAGVIGLLIAIFKLVCNCLIINKAEGNWWKGIIPFYNRYTLFTLAFNQKTAVMMFIAFIILNVITFFLNGFSNVIEGFNNSYSGSSSSSSGAILGVLAGASLIMVLISGIVTLLQLAIRCFYHFGIGKSFGMPTWFNVLSIFFPTITSAVLAFGSAEYEGDTVDIIPD